jgi:hypothetical protein
MGGIEIQEQKRYNSHCFGPHEAAQLVQGFYQTQNRIAASHVDFCPFSQELAADWRAQ